MMQVYGLVDPRNDKVRYVGLSKNMQRRYQSHASKSTVTTRDWFDELKALGMSPGIILLEEVESQDGVDVEYEWIFFYQQTQGDLLNRRTRMPHTLISKNINWTEHRQALTIMPRFSLEYLERMLERLTQDAARLEKQAEAIRAQQYALNEEIVQLKQRFVPEKIAALYKQYFFT